MDIRIVAKWEYDEYGYDYMEGKYTSNPDWSGIVFDRQTGKLTRNNKFGGIGEKRFIDRNECRYIQLDDNGGTCRQYIETAKLIEDVNDGNESVYVLTVSAECDGREIASSVLGGIVAPDAAYKAECEQALLSELRYSVDAESTRKLYHADVINAILAELDGKGLIIDHD